MRKACTKTSRVGCHRKSGHGASREDFGDGDKDAGAVYRCPEVCYTVMRGQERNFSQHAPHVGEVMFW